MHGMLSAAVMLAAFAVIALAAAGSVVWLYRAAGASPQRSRPVLAGLPGDAAGPDTPAVPGVARPSPCDGLAGPDQGAGPRVAVEVYDVEDWAAPDESRGLDGLASRDPGTWPNPSSSLYSRGWPAMDSSRAPRDPAAGPEPQDPDRRALGSHDGQGIENPGDGPDGQGPEDLGDGRYGQGSEDWDGQGSEDWDGQGSEDWDGQGPGDQVGQDRGPQEPGSREPGSREPGSREPGSREPGSREPGSREPGSQEPDGPDAAASGRPEGARVYVLGESRRRGR